MGSRSIASIPARPAPSARRACSPPAPPSWGSPRKRRSAGTSLRTRRGAMPSAAWWTLRRWRSSRSSWPRKRPGRSPASCCRQAAGPGGRYITERVFGCSRDRRRSLGRRDSAKPWTARRRGSARLHPGGSGGSVGSPQLPPEEAPLSAHLSAAQIKARLDHPIIDADGHWIEYGPVFTEELRRVGGEDAVEGWNAVRNGTRGALGMSVEERRRRRISQEAFWGHPSKNTKDLATALFPRLLAERLDEIGLDFAIIYPTGGLRVPRVGADKPRRAAARAYNIVTAEYFGPFADRMTPAAIIPMHTPEEAIEELEFAVKQLGYKVA